MKLISKRHLRFRCLVFDEHDPRVRPMIYLQVIGRNAVCIWDEYQSMVRLKLSIGDDDYLMAESEAIQLTSQVWIRVRLAQPDSISRGAGRDLVDELQAAELKHLKAQAQDFEVTEQLIGYGAHGRVYLARHVATGRQMACKAVSIYKLCGHSAALQQRRGNELKALARELYIATKLSHPNVVTINQVYRASGNVFILQELIPGGDLMSCLSRKGPFADVQVLVCIFQVAKAVAYVHEQGIVHRDIKPENIMLASWKDGPRYVLTDFGCARMIPRKSKRNAIAMDVSTRMNSVAGTPGYLAP